MKMEMLTRVPQSPSPSDKVQVTKNPPALPRSCVICNASSNGMKDFIDFNFSIDYYGAVYFCSDCMIPIALSLGLCFQKDLIEAEQEANDLRATLEGIEDELTYYRSFVDSLSRIRPDLSDAVVLDGPAEKSNNQGTSESDQGPESDNKFSS